MMEETIEKPDVINPAAEESPAPGPVPITGQDFKRAALCAGDEGRFALHHVELGSLGLVATDGRVLCVLNHPGWTERRYIQARQAKGIAKDSLLAVNGHVEFVGTGRQSGSRAVLQSATAEAVRFPVLYVVLPQAGHLTPIATVDGSLLKKLLSALERAGCTQVTIYGNNDRANAPMLLANNHGDLGLLMPLTCGQSPDTGPNFPEAIYQALGRSTTTAAPLSQAPESAPVEAA